MLKEIPWEKISEFTGPEESPGFLLWQVSSRWRRLIEAALAPLDLTHPQFVLLASLGWLTKHSSKPTQVELARHCHTDIAMTSQVLRTLEQKGLITRTASPEDQRSKLPSLTPAGARLIAEAIPLVEQVDRKFFHGSPKELTALLRTLVLPSRGPS